jgi:hypothetical protein
MPDWWYFALEAGQHVFFNSKDALFWIAKEFGYHLSKGRAFSDH